MWDVSALLTWLMGCGETLGPGALALNRRGGRDSNPRMRLKAHQPLSRRPRSTTLAPPRVCCQVGTNCNAWCLGFGSNRSPIPRKRTRHKLTGCAVGLQLLSDWRSCSLATQQSNYFDLAGLHAGSGKRRRTASSRLILAGCTTSASRTTRMARTFSLSSDLTVAPTSSAYIGS